MVKSSAGRIFFLAIGILFFTFPALAQQTGLDDLGDQTPRLMLALSTADYPATPGDVYNLSYYAGLAGSASVSMPLVLDAGYQLKVQNMGTINARNKTYLQVRREVESLVSQNYPMSGPSLTLVRMGSFTVLVTGETTSAGNRSVDGLTRVSALSSALTGKASIRFIRVTGANGTTRTYDLFAAGRNGDLSQNPYVSPGDRIVIPVAGRIVQLQGEVYRAGRYELLEGEELAKLIEGYGSGFTNEAAPDKLTITRLNPKLEGSRDLINLSWEEKDTILLQDGDIVGVANKERNRQAVFFEGAVFSVAEDDAMQDREERTHTTTRMPHYFYPGETIGQAGRSVRAYFSDVSDLSAVYILRGSEQIPVNLERLLYRNETEGDIPLASGDVIVVPYRRYYTITGEVNTAGNRALNSLTRLSSLLTDLTAKASSRLVMVTPETGAAATYDLFQTRRFSDLSQDPYIRPGDTIRILPAGRTVTLAGEVFRPGVYELLPGEELAALVEQYGDGFTLAADPGRIRLARIDTEGAGETTVFDYKENTGMILKDRDIISVGNKALTRPTVFFEGALFPVAETEELQDREERARVSTRIPHYFYPGETIGQASRSVRAYFSDVSDLSAAYILRDTEQLAVNLERFLYRNETEGDIPLASGDIIMIPYRRFYTIIGEVNTAGNRALNSLTRLSALLTDLTAKASSRLVMVTPETGAAATYDLFQTRRFGDLSQDPYIRPGDTIRILPAGRRVTLAGEVFRPGVYELFEDEQLTELIEGYGSGFTKEAAQDKLVITRLNPKPDGSRELINLSWQDKDGVTLEDGDIIGVANKESNRQAVFFEGALFPVAETEELQDREERARVSTRIPHYFYPGETIGQASRSMRAYFSDVSDLSAAYILRDTEQIAVNLERFLYRNEAEGDIPLAGGDIIVIPYRRFYTLTGEVNTAGNRALNSLTRLSALLTDLTAKASSRLVMVTPETGAAATYDLFQARRFGDLSQDPYIRPGDAVRILPAGRTVTLSGEVFRPGVYELLPGEDLAVLVEQYGDGFTLAADPERIRLARIDTEGAGETKVFDYKENAGMILKDKDLISVGNKALSRPVVFFEGAISPARGAVETTTADVSGAAKMEHPFYEGETLGNAALANAGRFTASSDLANAYVIRNGRHIAMDLRRYIYYNDFARDIALENGDVIIIPFRQYFVLVSGAVKLPGKYPYVPDRQADYYINLAGGRDDLQNNGRGVSITDMNKKKIKDNAMIEPETIIWVPTNRFTAYFNQYGPIITTILSIVSTALAIFAITGRL